MGKQNPLKILIIDDDQVDRMRLRRLLRDGTGLGLLNVDEAVDKASGLTALASSPYDVILLDFQLPDGDGLSFLHELQLKECSAPPVVMQTVLDDEEIGLRAVECGAQDYLVKGRFDGSYLARTIRYALERHKLLQQNRALVRELERLTTLDDLTGAYNRRYLDAYLELRTEEARRYQGRFAVVMLDIDGFKTINDTYGHQLGDLVLREVVRVLRSRLRVTDTVARYGGDEFVIVLLDATVDRAMRVSESLKHAAAELVVLSDDRSEVTTTLSMGVAAFPADAQTSEALLARCDERLYAAKQAGKNCICAGGRR